MRGDPSQILKETNDRISNEMIKLFDEIISLIQIVEPIELVEELSARMLLSNDFLGNANSFLTLSQLEFIVGLLLNKEQYSNTTTKLQIQSSEIAILANKVQKYFGSWSFTYHFNKKKGILNQSDSEKERDLLISSLVSHHATVRGDTFYEQEEYQLLGLFRPFKDWMDSKLGFNIEDAIFFTHQIKEYYLSKLDSLMEPSSETKGIIPSPNISRNARTKKQKQSSTTEYETYFPTWDKGILTFKVSDISGISATLSDRFQSFLSLFTSVYGQTFNNNFKFPSDSNIFRSKPFFRFEDVLILPSPSSLIWAMQSVLEDEMKTDNKQWDKYQKQKGKYLETEVAKEFQKIFPKATIYQSLFYKSVEKGELKQFELDGLVVYDTNLILVESKSGVFSESARTGGVKRLERIIRDNIEAAFEQAFRARDYINNSEVPIFCDEKGNELIRIDKAHYYRVFLINLTLDNFGEVATMLQDFRKAGLYRYDEYPLSLNLNDLKIMTESIAYPSQFLHYIHRRVSLNNRVNDKSSIITTDELDLFAQYFETNLYYDNETKYDAIYIPDYAPEFNQRHLLKMMGKPVPPLEQKLNPHFKRIILDLEGLGEFGFTNIIITLLDLNSESRENLIRLLETISNKARADGKFHDFSMVVLNNPKEPKSGVGITCKTGLLKDRKELAEQLLAHCQLKKNQQRCYEWIGIGRYVDSTRWFVDEALYMRYEEEYDEELDRIARATFRGKQITFSKIGRNDPCPCGSGIKYKKCHGAR